MITYVTQSIPDMASQFQIQRAKKKQAVKFSKCYQGNCYRHSIFSGMVPNCIACLNFSVHMHVDRYAAPVCSVI